MKHVKSVAILSLAALLFGTGVVVGQQAEKPITGEEFDKLRWAYRDNGNAETSEALFKAYRQAPDNPEVVKAIMQNTLSDAGNTPLLLLQAAQNQKLIEQNNRIIALLEQQAKDKGK